MVTPAWNDAFNELWMHAAKHRGLATSLEERPGPIGFSTFEAWPRTRGSDVLAIAAVVDPVLRALPAEPSGYAIEQRWRDCASELAYFALEQPDREYAQNRTFWATLGTTAAYLATFDAPVPVELWRALLAELASTGRHRNYAPAAVGRRGMGSLDERRNARTYEIKESSFEKTWDAQHDELGKARGFDVREPPPGAPGRPMKVPRTTNADILRLAAYWSSAWGKLEARWARGGIVNPIGLKGERTRWRAVMADVETYAKLGKPDDVYPKNHEFWRASLSLATTLGVFDEQPTPFDLLVDSLGDSVKRLPERIADAAGAISHAVGNIAHEAGAGLFSGLGTPLLVGGGVLLGLFLLLRHRDPHEAA